MWSLGLSMEYEASATLSRDGEVVAAISEERLSRNKGQWGYPWLAIDECLRIGGVDRSDIDIYCIALNKLPSLYFHKPDFWNNLEEKWHRARRKISGRPEKVTLSLSDFMSEVRLKEKVLADLFDWERFREDGFTKAHVRLVDHHYAHAYAAARHSGFTDALVVTLDCVGACCTQDVDQAHTLESIFLQNIVPLSHTTSTWQNGSLRRQFVSDLNGSPGSFYGSVTEGLGFVSPRHEGKVTGLAAWGKPSDLDRIFRHTFTLSQDKTHFISEQIWKRGSNISESRKQVIHKSIEGKSREEVSGAAQRVLEDSIIGHVTFALKHTGMRRLALAGGVFGNVKLNQRLMEIPGVEDIFIFPAMSDTGLSVAAAQIPVPGPSTPKRLNHVYWGPSFTESEIESALKTSGLRYEKLPESDAILRTAKWISENKAVGVFQGRMEFGPRALGNRSILASPVDPGINDRLNQRLSRSEFMPFAPSVLAEACESLFENFSKISFASEFMTVTCNVKSEWRNRIPAVVHIDGTARPQSVHADRHPRLHAIIKAYEKISGLPAVINTSFNVHEEPIVCSPKDAIQAIRENRVDALLMETFWVTPPS